MAQRIRKLIFLSLFNLSFFMSQAWSFCLDEFDGSWYLSAGAGRSMYRMDSNNYINPGPGWPNDYYYKNDIHDGSFIDIGGGYSLIRYTPWFPGFMLGIDYTYAFQASVTGFIKQYTLDQFLNYSYTYDFSRQTVLALFKATIYRFNGFMPYLTVGTGPSFNRASDYTEEPLTGVTPRVSPGYGTSTHNSWAYILGVGFDYVLRDDVALGFEYNYGDFGKVYTSNGAGTPMVTGVNYSGQHLSNTLKANTFLMRFTYLLDCK